MTIVTRSKFTNDPTLTVQDTGCKPGDVLYVDRPGHPTHGQRVVARSGLRTHDNPDARGKYVVEVRYPDGVFATRADRLRRL